MSNLKRVLLIFVFFSFTSLLYSQNINGISNVDNMTDEQVMSYWKKIQAKGLSLDQIEKIAKTKGISDAEISKFKQRVSSLSTKVTGGDNKKGSSEKANSSQNSSAKFGHSGGDVLVKKEKSNIFGFNFFTNPNISFAPNLNLATPNSYQLGPGDEISIDIWGAAENNYTEKIGVDGTIRIENIGPVQLSGLSIKEAKSKIKSKLSRIYGGINSSESSYSKVNVGLSLVQVRSVQVNIIGEVRVPGTYSLSALSTVLNALYAAGGPTTNGTFRDVKVFRRGKLLTNFDVYQYLIKGSQEGNTFLRDQDVIIVSPYKNRVTVGGSVKRPGVFEFKEGETLNDLISFFGGFKSNAYRDRITIERIEGNQREIKEIYIDKDKFSKLKDGDKYSIASIIDKYTNRLTVSGAVYRPGALELTTGLKLSEAIKKAGGVKEDAFLDRGVLYRVIPGGKTKIISFSLKDILKGENDIELQNEDKVRIFNVNQLKEKYAVSIDGAINKPQTVPYVENMRVEDLIAVSGGFKEGADVNSIEISRRANDGTIKTISESIKLSTSNNLVNNVGNPIYLKPFDRVSVRYLRGFTTQKTVFVEGEANYPGKYALVNKEERISDLLEKSGGVSPYAYVEGATLIRNYKDNNRKVQNAVVNDLNQKQDSTVIGKKSSFSIGIDLDKIIKNKGSKYDLILKEGDKLVIPTIQQTVKIEGEVLSPSVVRFDRSKSLRDYVNNAGGFSEEARKSKVYVVYANGEIKSTKRFLFFKTYPKLKPGALILVPKKSESKDPLTTRDVIGITTSITTLGILINTLVK